ncbi:MAG: septum site-determining protein MinC [Chloroflexi bacterium]|nr:septum site-determining protein MinC [Chloroflexota bacterium]
MSKIMLGEQRQKMQIKGIKDGLLVTLGEGEWSELEEALIARVEEQAGFFQGARMALDVGNHVLRAVEMGALRDKLSSKGISLWAVISNSQVTEQTALMLGLATRISTPRPERVVRPLETTLTGENAVFVQRTLRSGYKVAHNGHVVVLGDVNPGAEVIAGGNIIIWGRLRGVVHAGADGDESAVVCALDMAPTQLRIARLVATSPNQSGGWDKKVEPEIARIENGQLVSEPWYPKK